MIKPLKDFTPAKESSPYNPAKTATVPANDTAEIQLQGRSADVFGLNRILPYCSNLNAIKVEARLNNERILFEDVQLSAIRELFLDSELLAPLIIQQNNDLRFTLTNTSGADIDVNMELLGYDGPSLRKLVGMYKNRGVSMPTPIFLYASSEIAANAVNQRVDIPTKSVDVNLHRMAVRTASDSDIRLSLQIYNETIKNGVYVQQLNDEFSNGRRAKVPYNIQKNVPFNLTATNGSANPQTLSVLGEAYSV